MNKMGAVAEHFGFCSSLNVMGTAFILRKMFKV